MVAIIFFFVLLIFGITLFATNNTATIPNKNILLGVTLPTFALKDGAVTDIVKKYKKSFYTLFLGSFVFTLPIFVFGSYPSFTMIYAFIWIALLLYFNNKIYTNHYKLLSSLKRKNDWFVGNKHIVTIDTEVLQLKSKMPVSRLWFVPAFAVGLVPLILEAINRNVENINRLVLCIIPIIIIFPFIYLHRLYSFARTNVYSQETNINLACNYVYKRLWSICWVVTALIFSISYIPVYLGSLNRNSFIFTIFLCLPILSVVLIIIYTHSRILSIQNKLLEASRGNIYTDDDEFWEKGYYYNPKDTRAMVEKRIGYGYTLNMATMRGKLFTFGILIPVAAFIIFLSIMLVRFDTADFKMIINGNAIKISAPVYSYSFNANDIEKVELVDNLPDGTKTNGAATDRYSLGNFSLSGYGRSKMYVHNENPPFIAIKLKDIYLFINGKSREVTEQYYNMLLQYTN